MYPDKLWHKNSIDRLIRKIGDDGSTQRKSGSGRPKYGRTAEEMVEEMICKNQNLTVTELPTKLHEKLAFLVLQ